MNFSLKRQRVHQRAREVATLCWYKCGYIPDLLYEIAKATESDEAFLKWQKSNPDQPHVPGGYTTGGQFTADGTNGGQPTGWGGDANSFSKKYIKHAKDFEASSPQEYIDKAKNFYQKFQNEDLPAVQNKDEYIKVYEPDTNTFGVYNPNGDPVTFFKPSSPTYFDRETQEVLDNGGKIINPRLPSGTGGGNINPFSGAPGKEPREPWDILE